ncbi:MAG: DUF599 family protein [Candidatus Hodarchaeales archaeon]
MDITIDLIALLIFLVCIGIYGMMIGYGLKNPQKTRRGSLNLIYEEFVNARVKDSSIIAVQAMRNLIMANSAFISALLVLMGLLFAFYSILFSEAIIPGSEISLGTIQLVVMIIIIVFCLFNFVLAIRKLVRFTLLISSHPDKLTICNVDGLNFTKDTLISAQNHWLFGLRGLFYLVISMTWLANPILFLGGSIAVTSYLIFFEDIVDRNHVELKT